MSQRLSAKENVGRATTNHNTTRAKWPPIGTNGQTLQDRVSGVKERAARPGSIFEEGCGADLWREGCGAKRCRIWFSFFFVFLFFFICFFSSE